MIALGLLAPAADAGADALARLGNGGKRVAKDLGIDLEAYIESEKLKGGAGQVTTLPVLSAPDGYTGLKTLLLIGLGAAGDKSASAVARTRAAIKTGAALARSAGAAELAVTTIAADLGAPLVRSFVEGAVLASYTQDPQRIAPDGKKSKDKKKTLGAMQLVGLSEDSPKRAAIDAGVVTAAAVCAARDLVNQPAATKTPDWLAQQAVALTKHAQVKATVLDEKQLKAQGFGGILGVGQGAIAPPRLVQLDYTPKSKAATRTPHVVLVGKGITFDTGGLSLKPNDSMVSMKTDMGGAGAVIGAIAAIAQLGVSVRVTALLAIAENAFGGNAIRPGDVLHHFGGTTVEVLNTDAEGRLVLADALAFASMTMKPDAIIDIATLTGAMPVALGRKTAGLFASDDRLAQRLADASDVAGERLWRLPLFEDYLDSLESPVADMTNISRAVQYQGGSITAALFLRDFTGGLPWAHLDIAGTGRADGDDEEIVKGATAYGVRTLVRLLESW